MWPDNETDRDLLNFDSVAETVAQIVVDAQDRPVSIGVSGAWGSGKSSLIKLTRAAIAAKQPKDAKAKYVFVEFNAWLYQGYDDARAALLDVIASALEEEAEERQTGIEKVGDFLKRVQWLRLAKLVALPAAGFALGLGPVGLLGSLADLGLRGSQGELAAKDLEEGAEKASALKAEAAGLIAPKKNTSPPKEIQALRDSFEAALEELGITLVVLIDDLDRCLPETTISTLEAIRLFLFLKNTAFVIAADDEMIKNAVRRHFGDLTDDRLITSYFDKLVQIPIRVPVLGVQEVRAYVIMLFVDNSDLTTEEKDKIRAGIAKQLKSSWTGARVDVASVRSIGVELPLELLAQLDTAERLAPLMAVAGDIQGNPRLVKRFLNALSIRMAMARSQGVAVDEAVLAKLLLFERLAPPKLHMTLANEIVSGNSGIAGSLAAWEAALEEGEPFEVPVDWDLPFMREWVALPPALGALDLRAAMYVSRELAPTLSSSDQLSSQSAQLLKAMISEPAMARELVESLREVARPDLAAMLDSLLSEARKEQAWGVPPILVACLAVVEADETLSSRLAAFLVERPATQIQPSIVPKIRGFAWSTQVFEGWRAKNVAGPVLKAIDGGSS